MKKENQVGYTMAILAGGMMFAGSASADLTFSSTADDGSSSNNDANWSGFATYAYNQGYTGSAPDGAGSHYLRTNGGAISKSIDLSSEAAVIDVGRATWDFEIWLGSYTNNIDRSQVTISFRDAQGQLQGSSVLYDDGATENPNGQWNYYGHTGSPVPKFARTALITIDNSIAAEQSGSNDGYADLVSFHLKEDSNVTTSLDSTSGVVSVGWPAYDLSGLTAPEIRVSRDNVVIATLAANLVNYSDSPLAPQTGDINYTYEVELYDGAVAVADSAGSTILTWPLTGLITDLTAIPDNLTGNVNLAWTAAGDEFQADGIKIFRDAVEVGTLALNADSFTDTSATPAQTYFYTVRAYGGWQGGSHTDLTAQVTLSAGGVTAGLIANYSFENGFKDTASAAVTHDGTAINGTSVIGNGVSGHAITLSGQVKQGVSAADHSTLDFGDATDFTVSVWMKRKGSMNSSLPNGEANDGVLICKQNWSSGSSAGWGIYATSDGGVKWNLAGSSRMGGDIVSGASVADDRWHHILVSSTRAGNSRCFVDGVFVKSISISGAGSVDNSLPLSMGVDGNGNYSWTGELDEVALWNRALGDSEATDVFRASEMGLALSGKSIIDSDGDDMGDAWELLHFSNTGQDATGDYDGDGISNFQEYAQGSNPNSANSTQANRVTIEEFDGQDYPILHYTRPTLTSNIKYIAESSQDLTNWSSLSSNFIPFGNPTDKGNGDSEHHIRYYQTLSAVTAGKTMMRVRMESQYQGAISESINPIVELRDGKAYITWTTSSPTVSIIDYSLDGQTLSRYEDYSLSTSHSVEIANFQPGESFSYTVIQVTDGIETKSNTFSIDGKWDYSPPAVVDQVGFDSGSDWSSKAAQILALPNVIDRGYALDAQCGDGRLAYELARQSQLVIIGVEDTQAEVDAARAFLEARGVYGSRVTVVLAADLADLPFPADFFNLVVSQNQVSTASDYATFTTAMDTLAIPNRGIIAGYNGSAMQATKKAVRAGTGSWTMSFGNPANTSASAEEFSGKNKMTDFELRWLGAPGSELAWDRQIAESPPLVANGRFYCQGKGRILSLDSHNGSVLWSKELDDAQRFNMLHSAGNLTADEDAVWLAFNKECWKMDGDTGALTTFSLIEGTNSNIDYEWSYICRTGNHLLGSATSADAAYADHWGGGFWYVDSGSHVGKVVSDNLFSLDKDTGTANWEYKGGLIVDVTVTVGNNRVYFLETRNAAAVAGNSRKLGLSTWSNNLHLVCLDLETGNKLWDEAHSLTGGQRNTFLMYDEVNDRLVINTGDGSSNHLYAFNAATGAASWNASAANYKNDHGGKNQKAVITNGKVYLTPNVYDIVDGSVLSSNIPSNGGQGCNTYWGSKNMLFFRTGYSDEGLSMWPVDNSSSTDGLQNVRGACWLNWAPADGMFLIQEKSSGCSCGQWIHVSLGWGPKS